MELYEAVSGGADCMPITSAPAEWRATCLKDCWDDVIRWIEDLPEFLADIEELLSNNVIFKQRTVDIGIVSAEEAQDWGFFRADAPGFGDCMGFTQEPAL